MDRLVVIVCDEDSNCFGYAEWLCSWRNDTTSNWPIIFEFNGKLLHFDHLFYYPKSSEVARSCKIIVENREEAEKEIEKLSQDNRWTNIFKVENEVPKIPTDKTTIKEAGQKLYTDIKKMNFRNEKNNNGK